MINSRLESFVAPSPEAGKTSCELTSSYFAEFLNEGSLVHLRLLAQSTCVGFSTDIIGSPLARSIEVGLDKWVDRVKEDLVVIPLAVRK